MAERDDDRAREEPPPRSDGETDDDRIMSINEYQEVGNQLGTIDPRLDAWDNSPRDSQHTCAAGLCQLLRRLAVVLDAPRAGGARGSGKSPSVQQFKTALTKKMLTWSKWQQSTHPPT